MLDEPRRATTTTVWTFSWASALLLHFFVISGLQMPRRTQTTLICILGRATNTIKYRMNPVLFCLSLYLVAA